MFPMTCPSDVCCDEMCDEMCEFLATCPDQIRIWCGHGCGPISCGKESLTHILSGAKCSHCSNFVPAYTSSGQHLDPHQHPGRIITQPRIGVAIESSHNLSVLGGFAARMKFLQHLGLHCFSPSLPVVRNLGQLLSSLPLTVTTLTLAGLVLGSLKQSEKRLFLRAVAQMRGLRKLRMPQWEAVVGDDAGVCVQPLRALPHLLTIFVV